MILCVFIYHNTPNSIYCLKCFVEDYTDYRWGSIINIIHQLTFDILMPSGVLITAQMLICYSTHSLVTQCLTDGMWGAWRRRVGGISLGGTTDPLPLPISCTNNMPHASGAQPILSSDRASAALGPPTPGTTGHSAPARCVDQPPLLAP